MATLNPTLPNYPLLPGRVLYGTNLHDVIVTTSTTPSVDARAGNDLIMVANSVGKSLTVLGGLGSDTVSYAGAAPGVIVHLDNNSLNAGAAQGHIFNSVENLIGTDDHDMLYGNQYANRLVGGGGIDYLFGGAGNDILEGGAELDYINGDEGNDIAYGGAGNDSINGNAGNDTLYGEIGGDTLRGGEGNDTLVGGLGADILFGGDSSFDDGIDTVSYANSGASIGLSLAAGVGNSGDAAGDSYFGIENVIGSSGGGSITGNDNDNVIQATEPHAYFASENYFYGQGGNDTLIGAALGDILYGEEGDDRVFGRSGDDHIIEDVGNDYIDGGEDRDWVYYSNSDATAGVVVDLVAGTSTSAYFGNDTLVGIEVVGGSVLDDIISGDGTDNRLVGHLGNDELHGRGGRDEVLGNWGDDELYGEEGDDWLEGGDGTDLLHGGDGNDTAHYDIGNANLTSGAGQGADGLTDTLVSIENLRGSNGDNQFTGNNQDNVLDGGGGNDTLNGRRGNDTLIGGAGEDTFVFDQNGFANDQDVVEDFEIGIDRLDFSASSIDGLDEFFSAATQAGADVVIDTGNGAITLLNVQLSAMSFGDFIF